MKKTVNRVLIICLAILLLLTIFINDVQADTIDLVKVIESSKTTFNEGEINKRIVSIDSDKKETEIQLSIKNNKGITINDNTEVVFVLDNSESMKNTIETGNTRRYAVADAVKELIEKIHADNEKCKMGIVKFQTSGSILNNLTNDRVALINTINSYIGSTYGNNTNIVGGLEKAKGMFSSSASNKIIIVLTDGIPTVNKATTKSALQDSNYYIISVLTGVKGDTSKEATVTEIFGTEASPSADKFYNILDTELSNTISGIIYNKILDVAQVNLTDIKISDYFPDDIINNFDITVEAADKGSKTYNTSNNSVEWNIGTLKSGETANLKYKLKLKDNYSERIFDKALNTNEKVTMNYKNLEGANAQAELIESPQIKLVKNVVNENNNTTNQIIIKNEINNTVTNNVNTVTNVNAVNTTKASNTVNKVNIANNSDNTTIANTKLPHTGDSNIKGIVIVAIVILIAILAKKNFDMRDIK